MRFWIALGLAALCYVAEMQFYGLWQGANPFEVANGAEANFHLFTVLSWYGFVGCQVWALVEGLAWIVRHVRRPARYPAHPRG
jgi:hypothetical protein